MSGNLLLGNDNSTRDYFDLFGDEPAVPDANELLSLKILKDANPESFKGIAAEETKWIALALGLLRRDPYLQIRLKGKGIRSAMKLASHLKRKAEQQHFDSRLEQVIKVANTAKFAEPGWSNLTAIDDKGAALIMKDGKIDAMGGHDAMVFGKTS